MPNMTPEYETTEEPRPLPRGSRLFVVVILLLVLGLPVVAMFLNPVDGGSVVDPPTVKLPDLELQPLTGTDQAVSLDDLEGQVVLINFWGTWCPPCVEEFPHIANLHQEYKNRRDFRLLAVSCTNEDLTLGQLREETQSFLDRQSVTLPTYADPERTTRMAVYDTYGFSAYPTTVLLDKQHFIRKVWDGFDPDYPRQMHVAIEELLSE